MGIRVQLFIKGFLLAVSLQFKIRVSSPNFLQGLEAFFLLTCRFSLDVAPRIQSHLITFPGRVLKLTKTVQRQTHSCMHTCRHRQAGTHVHACTQCSSVPCKLYLKRKRRAEPATGYVPISIVSPLQDSLHCCPTHPLSPLWAGEKPRPGMPENVFVSLPKMKKKIKEKISPAKTVRNTDAKQCSWISHWASGHIWHDTDQKYQRPSSSTFPVPGSVSWVRSQWLGIKRY